MAILQDNMQAPAQPQAQGQLPAPNPEITSPLVQSHIDELTKMRELMDDKMGNAYDRVLTDRKSTRLNSSH